jgi:hypothetical protein
MYDPNGNPILIIISTPWGRPAVAGLIAGTLAAWALLTWRLFDVGEPDGRFAQTTWDGDFLTGGFIPIGSMYGIYANIGGILMVNVTIYSIHGSYGIG